MIFINSKFASVCRIREDDDIQVKSDFFPVLLRHDYYQPQILGGCQSGLVGSRLTLLVTLADIFMAVAIAFTDVLTITDHHPHPQPTSPVVENQIQMCEFRHGEPAKTVVTDTELDSVLTVQGAQVLTVLRVRAL